jgi:O-antigen/teichoic acid export membrane protein
MNPNNQNSYRQIVKATSLFGGVQIINILIQIIRSKIIAVLLGPAGIGIMALLNSTLSLIKSSSDFGLGVSAVQDIALSTKTANNYQIGKTVTIVRRLVWITGALGTLIVLVLSPLLSKLAFGNKDFTIAFIWISISLLFQQLSTGQFVILQGMRKIKLLAKANVLGSALGLIFTLPFYYNYGVKGIVPGIIGTSLIVLLVSWYFSRKIIIEEVDISFSQTYTSSKKMLKMGLMISLSSFLAIGASYILRIFINKTGGIIQVGLYDAGFMIVNTYVGLVFTAMSTDYFPRLSSVSENNKLCRKIINQQAEIAILILAPILVVFLFFIKEIVILLYSNQFVEVNQMIYWAALGVFFKAVTWAIGYVLLAKSNSILFFISELVANIYTLLFNILGYHYFGLEGLGISFLFSYMISLIQVFLIAKTKYNFSIGTNLLKIFFFQLSIAILSFTIIYSFSELYAFFLGIFMILFSCWYSFKELDSRINFKQFLSAR